MLARTDETEEAFLQSPANRRQVLLQTLKDAAGQLEELTHDSAELDAMIDENVGDISAVTLAMNIVWDRVTGRSAA
jgi:hypothetical protein